VKDPLIGGTRPLEVGTPSHCSGSFTQVLCPKKKEQRI
jgi:hypothetical protein